MMRRAFCGFVIGSSLPATIWPIAGLGIASRELPAGTLDWFVIGLFFPVLFGLTNAVTVVLAGRKGWAAMLGIGAIMGFVSASTGTFIYKIPEIVYGLEGDSRYLGMRPLRRALQRAVEKQRLQVREIPSALFTHLHLFF